ncbi:meiotic PUF protein 1 [Mucor circinelloides]
MLSASATTSKPVAVDTDPTSITTAPQKFSNKFSFDTFDSPFHTPSLFVTNAPMKNTDTFSTFYTNADVFSHHGQFNQHQGPQYANQFSPDVYSIMADVESSGTRTPSPRVESLATAAVATTTTATSNTAKDDPFKMEPPFLYHPQHQRKNEQFFRPAFDDFNVRNQLMEANEVIQTLVRQMNQKNLEIERQRVTIVNMQTTLANKDLEYKDQEQAISKKLSEKMNQLALYQSILKSKGFDLSTLNEESPHSRLYDLAEDMHTARRASAAEADMSNCSFDKSCSSSLSSTSNHTSSERKINPNTVEYRRMFDKNVNIDWSLLVDRITKETDQQASIFMQQKLKCATTEQKQLIFKATLEQAYELMTNRFGNFLIQRQLELGTPEQIETLVQKMKGHVLKLTCEPFGCHVVQRALECVDETSKASLVSELLVRIPETITHKYACHVWQKIFEIRWQYSPPPIMKHIHQALENQWERVALDETGSLVIQNIFENMTETDKRPILNEVLNNIVSIAKGQWGNWVVQHVLEHAEKSDDREKAFQVVINESVQLSMDQFASKVVEKALRIGGQQFMKKFIHYISSNNANCRPRMALIDIASDQYGNYVVQWLINNACEDQKVFICRLIKRHMVSLRGSKYGQRVAFLVDKVLRNHEITTYPTTGSNSSC